MLKLQVNKGKVSSSAEGKTLDILTELTVGTVVVLEKILAHAPDKGIRDFTVKLFFEGVLTGLAKEAEDDE